MQAALVAATDTPEILSPDLTPDLDRKRDNIVQEEDDILDLTSRRRATTIRVTKKRSSYKSFMSLVDNKEKMDR